MAKWGWQGSGKRHKDFVKRALRDLYFLFFSPVPPVFRLVKESRIVQACLTA